MAHECGGREQGKGGHQTGSHWERHLDDRSWLIGRLLTRRCVTTVFCVNAKGIGGGSLLFLGPRSPSRALATSWRRVVPEPLALNRWPAATISTSLHSERGDAAPNNNPQSVSRNLARTVA